tara:strand:+ start:8677 stop:9279 length:603 start_codon:yes stop_codon:yes gene_type:complete
MRKAVLYTRVSTDDQSNSRQISDLTSKAAHYGMEVVTSFSDKISGSKGFADREGGSRLMEFVESTEGITDIVISEISRISRNVEDTKRVIRILSEKGINLHISNISMDTLDANGNTNPLVALVTAVLGGVAEYERELLRERTRSGVAHARAQGKQIGRVQSAAGKKAEELILNGTSVKKVVELTGMDKSQVYRIKRNLNK